MVMLMLQVVLRYILVALLVITIWQQTRLWRIAQMRVMLSFVRVLTSMVVAVTSQMLHTSMLEVL